jgi:hypothetical protein
MVSFNDGRFVPASHLWDVCGGVSVIREPALGFIKETKVTVIYLEVTTI